MTGRLRAVISGAILAVGIPATVAAQPQPAPTFTLAPATEGDCRVTLLRVPRDVDIRQIAIFVDGRLLTVRPARRSGDSVRLRLLDPLRENSIVGAALTVDGTKVTTQVQQPAQLHWPIDGKCERLEPRDDREVFESSGYLGWAFDNFAPALGSLPSSDPGSHTRMLAGIDAQYRLVGDKHDQFQVWLSTFTLHGVRSADVDCLSPNSATAALCGTDQGKKFFAIYQNATSLEASFDVRVELKTLQPRSELPSKVFVVGRFGFIDLDKDDVVVNGARVSLNPPKVFNNDMLGVGILSPAGPFRDSTAIVGWGRSERFQSNPGWNRLKINGMLVFDLVPGFKDSLEFWKRLAGSPRMFVSIIVDRNPGGPGPDAVNTYIGLDVDLRRIFFGLGG
jgi:hypothetical protein